MQEQTVIHDANLYVFDFDAAGDALETLREDVYHNPPHWPALPVHNTDFTTEWQMVSPEEADEATDG